MSKYANPWNGKRQWYKGKAKKLPTGETDKEYQRYCKNKKNKKKMLSYIAWCKRERRLHGMF